MKDKTLVMIPGPTPVSRPIQEQMGREIQAFGDPRFVADYKSVIDDLGELFGCDGKTFVIAGTGTLAMEMAISNVTKRGDNLLVVSHGYFGDRFTDIAIHKGLNVDVLSAEWGQIVPVEVIRAKLASKKYAAMTVSHVDTATGVCAPIAEIGEMMKEFPDTIYILDGVAATAGEYANLAEMNIDLMFTASQKAFGVCPGLFLLWANQKVLARRRELGMIPEYYVDFDKWIPIMDDPSKYFATPAINLVWALKESVRQIKEEGLRPRYERHVKNARAMQKALESLGFHILAVPEHRAVTLSNLVYPEGLNDAQFRSTLLDEGIVVAGGLAAYAGRMFRLGHMGNIDINDEVTVLGVIERALNRCGIPVPYGKSVGIYMDEMSK